MDRVSCTVNISGEKEQVIQILGIMSIMNNLGNVGSGRFINIYYDGDGAANLIFSDKDNNLIDVPIENIPEIELEYKLEDEDGKMDEHGDVTIYIGA